MDKTLVEAHREDPADCEAKRSDDFALRTADAELMCRRKQAKTFTMRDHSRPPRRVNRMYAAAASVRAPFSVGSRRRPEKGGCTKYVREGTSKGLA